jgi:hypothetical protein
MIKNSYTILDVNIDGIRLIRDGNVSASLIQEIFGKEPIITDGAKAAKFPQIELPQPLLELTNQLPPKEIRHLIILYYIGWPEKRIINYFSKKHNQKNG